ncbi:hypothetical protein FOYG_10679 [Fusarium oxysporum NRRL 32931]|uniref:Uncharacterized protein n=1 Tax=Fusarium oxysporum NRRL 32931 TaxID=660029 RepID=W9I0L9_FUSOX|nr:hypothetical protein FOYG_10679 [Fusarium oxysporum NRRL 32931]
MQARVAAATPLYARDDSKAVRLRKALRRLPNADRAPCGPDDGDLEDLPLEIDDPLIDQMNEARDSGSTALVCPLPLLEWYPSTEDLPRPHRVSARLSSLRQYLQRTTRKRGGRGGGSGSGRGRGSG